VRYFANPCTGQVRDAMSQGLLGCIVTPAQGNRVPPGCVMAGDNGKFGKGWAGAAAWWGWLAGTVDTYGPARFAGGFAVAPDVPFDAAATLTESAPWLSKIRGLGVPAAFAAQNGSEQPGMVPWDEVDVLFLGGDTAWKLGAHARDLTIQARDRGKRVHMGRVNSLRRLQIARRNGCHSADGTYLAFGPDLNLPKLLGWLRDVNGQGLLWEAS
jgi:hypothetical protein